MKYLKSQQGGVAPLVIVLVVVLAIAVGFAIKAHNKADATSSPSPSVSATASPASSPTTSPSADIFVVKELGIQFEVSADIKDLVYTVKTSNGVTAAYFSSSSLVAADQASGGKYCTPEADAPLGVIDLTTAPAGGEVSVKTISGKSLNYAHAQSVCSQSSSVMSLASSQSSAFVQALSSAEPVK